ncbi:MAG: hypothetical protein QW112_01065, partial [Candidatus Micrarchaeia archaeon]
KTGFGGGKVEKLERHAIRDSTGALVPNVFEIRYTKVPELNAIPADFIIRVRDSAETDRKDARNRIKNEKDIYSSSDISRSYVEITPFKPLAPGESRFFNKQIKEESSGIMRVSNTLSADGANFMKDAMVVEGIYSSESLNNLSRTYDEYISLTGWSYDPNTMEFTFSQEKHDEIMRKYPNVEEMRKERWDAYMNNLTHFINNNLNLDALAASIGQMSDSAEQRQVLDLIYSINNNYSIPSGSTYDTARNILAGYSPNKNLSLEDRIRIFTFTTIGVELGAKYAFLLSPETRMDWKTEQSLLRVEIPLKEMMNVIFGAPKLSAMQEEILAKGRTHITFDELYRMENCKPTRVISKADAEKLKGKFRITEEEIDALDKSDIFRRGFLISGVKERIKLEDIKDRGYLTSKEYYIIEKAYEENPSILPATVFNRLKRFLGNVIEIDKNTFDSVMKKEIVRNELTKFAPRTMTVSRLEITSNVSFNNPVTGQGYRSSKTDVVDIIGGEWEVPFKFGIRKFPGIGEEFETGYIGYATGEKKPTEKERGYTIQSFTYRPGIEVPLVTFSFRNPTPVKEIPSEILSHFLAASTIGATLSVTKGPTGELDVNYRIPAFKLIDWFNSKNFVAMAGGNIIYDSVTGRVSPEFVADINTKAANLGMRINEGGYDVSLSGRALALTLGFDKDWVARRLTVDIRAPFYEISFKAVKDLFRKVFIGIPPLTMEEWEKTGTLGVPKVTEK